MIANRKGNSGGMPSSGRVRSGKFSISKKDARIRQPGLPVAYDWQHLFTGQRQDLETGLYHYRNRQYHATLGTFVTRDPLEYEDSSNLYSYVDGRVTILVDTYGLKKPKQTGSAHPVRGPQLNPPTIDPNQRYCINSNGDVERIPTFTIPKNDPIVDYLNGLPGPFNRISPDFIQYCSRTKTVPLWFNFGPLQPCFGIENNQPAIGVTWGEKPAPPMFKKKNNQ